MEIHKELGKLGFSPKEALVYLELIKLGKANPALVAKQAKITRPTAYNILRSLVGKGAVSENLASTHIEFSPLPPEELLNSINKERQELDEKEKRMREIVESIKSIEKQKEYPVPKIRFVEQSEVKSYLYSSMNRLQRSAMDYDRVWYGFQDQYFVGVYGEWIKDIGKKFEKDNYEVRLFTNDSVAEKEVFDIAARKLKFTTKALFTSTVWVVGDYIVMVYAEKLPHYIVEIHDTTLAHNMRQMFTMSWELAQ